MDLLLRSAFEQGGGGGGLRAVIDENLSELAARPDLFPGAEVATFAEASHRALGRVEALLDERMAQGLVRRCHGDLHLRNICVIDGRPTIFDAIEFNDAIACIDVLYDLAFLLMDLDHRGLRPYANLVLNRYLQHRDDLPGLAAMPLYLSVRAAVRAKVSISVAASQARPDAARRLADEAEAYFLGARAYLESPPPRLIAVGGLSGTGKTCRARELAPGIGAPPGALHLRSDVLRKTRLGVDELTRLPPTAYTRKESEQVYEELVARARAGLAAIEAVAEELGVPFSGVWLEAPEEVMMSRVSGRRDDPSDSTPEVLRRQLEADFGDVSWHRLEASASRKAVAAAAQHILSS